jgi:hypothetical protein
MSDREHLERAYRRLLGWYPRAFREENGPEILAVLLAGAPDGQRRPGLAESADLIRAGLWLRLRPGVPASAPTVRAAVFFKPPGYTQAQHQAQMAELARIRARVPRHV